MNQVLTKIRILLCSMRDQESAQRDFVRSIYNAPNKFDHQFDKPAYLRRRTGVTLA